MIRLLLGAILIIGCAAPASAAIIVTAVEIGGDVVFTYSGTFDLTSMTSTGSLTTGVGVAPTLSLFVLGVGGTVDTYSGFTAFPADFGTGPTTVADSSLGDTLRVGVDDAIGLPTGYVSGAFISGSATFTGETFASLGLTTGTYVWTTPDDTITLTIGVPEPGALSLCGLLLLAVGFAARRKSASPDE